MTKTLRRELAERMTGLDEDQALSPAALVEIVDTAVHAVEAWLRQERINYALAATCACRGPSRAIEELIKEAVK
jgi:hypothetical protein